MTNLRLLAGLFRAAGKLAAVCAFAIAMAGVAAGQTNTFPASGNAGVGTTSPSDAVHIVKDNGGLTLDTATSGTIVPVFRFSTTGTGRASIQYRPDLPGLAFQTGGIAYPTQNRMVLTDSGNFGIGTTTPTQTLHVFGKGLFQNSGTASLFIVDRTDGKIASLGAGGISSTFAYDDTGVFKIESNSRANIASGIFGGAATTRFTIDLTGNVGIGTATPAFPLEVSKSQAAPTFFQVTNSNSSAGNAAGVRMFTSGNNALTLSATGNAGAGGYAAITQEANLPLLFQTNVTERMRITGGGQVGIGTASPDTWAKLHVYNAAGSGVDVETTGTASWARLRFVTPTRTYGWFAGDSTQGDAPNKIGLFDYTAGAFRMMFDSSGNVGVGTSNPAYKFDVQSGQINASGGLCIAGDCKTAWSQVGGGGSQWTGTSAIYYNGGNVGIGTSSPANNLQIGTQASVSSATPTMLSLGGSHSNAAGANLKLKLYDDGVAANTYGLGVSSGSMDFGVHSSAAYKWYAGGVNKMTLTSNGDLSVSGSIAAKYQDLAEWVPSAQQLASGTVVVLDTTKSNQVIASAASYDTRVAGVISTQPGITLGEGGEGKVLVATTGRVRVKVDASRGPIQIGDLLVTSDVPGVAMKSEPVNLGGVHIHRPGTIIGKALEPLAKGSGEILVLLSLQ